MKINALKIHTTYGVFTLAQDGEIQFVDSTNTNYWYTDVNSCVSLDPAMQYADFRFNTELEVTLSEFLSIRRKLSALAYVM